MKKLTMIACALWFVMTTGVYALPTFDHAVSLYQEGSYELAYEEFAEIMNAEPSGPILKDSQFYKADCAYHLSRFEDFALEVEQLQQTYPDDSRLEKLSYWKAKGLSEIVKWDEALQSADELLHSYPTSQFVPEAHFLKGQALFHLKQYDQFQTVMDMFCTSYLDSPHLDFFYYHRAWWKFDQGIWEGALHLWDKFLVDFPESTYRPEAVFHSASCLYSLGRFEESLHKYREFQASYSDSSRIEDAVFGEGMALYVLAQWPAARAVFKRIIQDYPDSAKLSDALCHAALCSFSMEDNTAFLEDARVFKENDPSNVSLHYIVYREGVVGMRQRRWADARELFQRYIADWPEGPDIRDVMFRRAICFANLNDRDGLQDSKAAFLQRYPDDRYPGDTQIVDLNFQEALIPYQQGLWEEAIAQFEQFLAAHQDFEHPLALEAQHELGNAWMKLSQEQQTAGNIEAAQQQKEQANEIFEANREQVTAWLSRHPEADPDQVGRMLFLSLETWFFAEDYPSLENASRLVLEDAQSESRRWLEGKIWLGIALTKTDELEEAILVFDEILAADLTNIESGRATQQVDKRLASALLWRIQLAVNSGDSVTANRCYQRAVRQLPDVPDKALIIQRYSHIGEQ